MVVSCIIVIRSYNNPVIYKINTFVKKQYLIASAVATSFFLGVTRRIKNVVSLIYLMMSKILGYRGKNASCTTSEAFY